MPDDSEERRPLKWDGRAPVRSHGGECNVKAGQNVTWRFMVRPEGKRSRCPGDSAKSVLSRTMREQDRSVDTHQRLLFDGGEPVRRSGTVPRAANHAVLHVTP